MVDPVETAQEQIGEAHKEHGETDHWPRIMAVTVSFLAAGLALAELGAKSSQTEYITHNISASDTWNFYQAKNLRASLRNAEASLLKTETGELTHNVTLAQMDDLPLLGIGTVNSGTFNANSHNVTIASNFTSTGSTAPVRNDAAGRQRLSVMCATSSGSP